MFVDAPAGFRSGFEVAGDELFFVADVQNERDAQRQVVDDGLHQAGDALPIPRFKSLKPWQLDLAQPNIALPVIENSITRLHLLGPRLDFRLIV